MKRITLSRFALALAIAFGVPGCSSDNSGSESLEMTRTFRTDDFSSCILMSPLAIQSQGQELALIIAQNGEVVALDPETGESVWDFQLPSPTDLHPDVAATPGLLGDHAVVVWQNVESESSTRVVHNVAMIDLEAGALDDDFPIVELAASKRNFDDDDDVEFLPSNAYSRSMVIIAHPPDKDLGMAYVSYGNIRDIQPWHGWVFEIDLDAWRQEGADDAVTAVLLTTPETACGTPGETGSDDMICGGGVWAPPGPLLVDGDTAEYELIIPTGNGQLDLRRNDFANTLMRAKRGLDFDPACDATACADFDPIQPADECTSSCENLFIPRLLAGQEINNPPDGRCDGKTFFECYALLDYDFGANVPELVELPSGKRVFIVGAKDGAVYLTDVEHMGTLYDRLPIIPTCGSDGGQCEAHWAGMMVTQPVVTTIDGELVAFLAPFIFDSNHPAGLVAIRIAEDDEGPRLEKLWEAPSFDDDEALQRFRRHNGRPILVNIDDQPFVALVDVSTSNGTLLVVNARTGAIAGRGELAGPGRRFVKPLHLGDGLIFSSCDSDTGPGHIERWNIQ